MSHADSRAVLAAVLRGAPVDRPLAHLPAGTLVREAERHGVRPLVADCLRRMPGAPRDLQAAFQVGERGTIAADLASEAALRGVLAALARAGVESLVFKGAQLAYAYYPRPDLRPRLDVDLLVRESDIERASAVLQSLGYQAEQQAGTAGVLYERPFTGIAAGGAPHAVDLHWRVANPAVFSRVGTFDVLAAESVAIPALGDTARGLGPLDALLVACVHRVAHHFDDDRLIWLYDAHLVASTFDETTWARFAQEIDARGVGEVCRVSLSRTVAAFGTRVPASLRTPADRGEVTARYLQPDRPHARVVLDDLRALPTWRARWRALTSHLIPPAAYMREVYAPASSRPLAWLYAVRAVRGARRWLAGAPRT